jgi:Na+/H+-dicarboxylate symporter
VLFGSRRNAPYARKVKLMSWYRKLHWQILIGLALGLGWGILAASHGWGRFTADWIAPFGTVFINGLKLIAVPLVLASLIGGVASLSDLKRLSRIGGKTIAIYLGTTALAVTLGLVIVNVLRPGHQVPQSLREELQAKFAGDVSTRENAAASAKQRGPLQPMVDLVPENFFSSASDNRNMLQVVFVALVIGVGIIQIPKEKARPLLDVVEAVNLVVIRLVDLVMLMAPLGVFALLAGTITQVVGDDVGEILHLLGALGYYCLAVVVGLAVHTFGSYGLMVRFLSPLSYKEFYKGFVPAQLVAFSTSSSAATLPVTMERCEERLGVSEEVSSFVLPLGATINMDGTALYQAVAAVFIAQALGMQLGLAAQLTIVLTAVLASIGTAAVPGAGIIMLVIILEAIGVPSAGIALIFGVDRILDMLRTVTNVTGDAIVAVVVAASEGQLGVPAPEREVDRLRTRGEM